MNKPYLPADNPRTPLSAHIESLLRGRGSLTVLSRYYADQVAHEAGY